MPDFFVLREAHMQAFRAAGLSRFRKKAATILRMRFPEDCAKREPAELEQRIEFWTKQARAAGLRTERQMIRYLASELLLARANKTVEVTRDVFTRLRDIANSPEQRSIDVLQKAAHIVKASVPSF